jgi:MFS family permease
VTQLGLRANAAQFAVLVGLNALVGAMVGLERSVLPLVGRHDFGLSSNGVVLTFIVAFGATKALTNLAAGTLADRVGRRRLLALGWLLALPVPLLIGLAPNWGVVVLANLFLGASQGDRMVDDGCDEDRPRRPPAARSGARAERISRVSRSGAGRPADRRAGS